MFLNNTCRCGATMQPATVAELDAHAKANR